MAPSPGRCAGCSARPSKVAAGRVRRAGRRGRGSARGARPGPLVQRDDRRRSPGSSSQQRVVRRRRVAPAAHPAHRAAPPARAHDGARRGRPGRCARNLDAAADEIARLQRMIDGLLLLSRADEHKPADRATVRRRRARHRASRGVGSAGRGAGRHRDDVGARRRCRRSPCPAPSTRSSTTTSTTRIAVAPGGHRGRDRGRHRRPDRPGAGRSPCTCSTAVPASSDEQLAAAFGRFWRAPGNDQEGTGLGLAIVAHLAASSGGEATLARRPGGGVDAAVRLPAAPVP